MPAAQRPDSGGPAAPGLRQMFSEFLSFPSPRLLLPVAGLTVGARLGLRRWTKRDAVIVAGILGAEPFTEWLIHVFVLHMRPRTLGGRRIDPLLPRKHREHHSDPRDPDLVFVPMPVMRRILPVALVGWALAERNLRTALTGAATSYAMLSVYEWTHYLIHSAYRPRHRPYRTLWRAHRLHHYRNERYWFGVTTHLGDRVLSTYPGREDVPLSPTARTLGVADTGPLVPVRPA